jgi:hypothetical protein
MPQIGSFALLLALALAALQRETGKLFAVVAQSNRDLEPWESDLRFWYCALAGKTSCETEVLTLPSSESDPYAGSSPHPETLERRALTLWRLAHHSQDFVLLTARALSRESTGTFAFQRPGKFRWEYLKPYEQLIVGDGEKLWVFDKDLSQVMVKKLDGALGSSPAAFFFCATQASKSGLETTRTAIGM